MKSIKTPGMDFLGNMHGLNFFWGQDRVGRCASVWKPTLKEKIYILLGYNIMSVFPDGKHPDHFYLKLTKQKESKW